MAGDPRSISELRELLDAGFTFAGVDSDRDRVRVTLARGSERETLTFGVEAAARLWASGLLDAAPSQEDAEPASLLTLQGLLRDGFSITSIGSEGDRVAVTLRDGEHRETLKLPAYELLALAPNDRPASDGTGPLSDPVGGGEAAVQPQAREPAATGDPDK